MSKKIGTGKNHARIANIGKAADVRVSRLAIAISVLAGVAIAVVHFASAGHAQSEQSQANGGGFDQQVTANVLPASEDGKQIFRFDTFGDEAF